jgi:RNA polymerase sigma-70 factor (ECF subfamily)
MKNKTDEELMTLYALEANEEAFTELYQRYAGQLYGYLCRKSSSQIDREAVLQETFMKLHHSKERYRPEFPFSTWIFTVCRNALADYYRKEKRFGAAKTALELEGGSSTEPQETSERFIPDHAFNQLSADQRKAVKLRYLEKLPFEAIAKELKKSEGNVRQLVSRGLRRLRLILEKR